VLRGIFEELTTEEGRHMALAALRGAHPDVARVATSGALFRIRPTSKTGRAVRRSAHSPHLHDVDHLLQELDLRAGDEMNFPRDKAE
jgi:hypothetical protein